jgi:hypothetical protein
MFDLTLARPVAAAPRRSNFNAAAYNADDHERRAILLVACVAGLGVIAASFLVLADTENTPRLDALSELAIASQRCDVTTDIRRPHECLDDFAQAVARSATSSAAPMHR